MTTKPTITFHKFTPNVPLPEKTMVFDNYMLDSYRFNRLFTIVFDNVKMKDVIGTAALRNILGTIANISNNCGR